MANHMKPSTKPAIVGTRRQFIRSTLGLSVASLLFGTGRGVLAASKLVPPIIDMSFMSTQIKIMRRSAWADHFPDYSKLKPLGRCTRITVHHQGAVFSATPLDSVVAQLNRVLDGHKGLGSPDVGYHFIVDYAGRVWEGRAIIYEGAHAAGENKENLAVMALGNYQIQKPSKKQYASMVKVVDILRREYKVKASRIYGHCDLGSTVCPGRNLYPVVTHVQKLATAKKT